MTLYKVAHSHDVSGISYHRSLKNAKISRNKEGSTYHIYKKNKSTGKWSPAE